MQLWNPVGLLHKLRGGELKDRGVLVSSVFTKLFLYSTKDPFLGIFSIENLFKKS